MYLFLAILILIISSIVNYGVSVPETSANKVPKGLISRLSMFFNLGTGIREKLVNNNRHNRGLSFSISSNKVVAFLDLFLLLMLSFLLLWLNTCRVFL
jgi:hypothetical protein